MWWQLELSNQLLTQWNGHTKETRWKCCYFLSVQLMKWKSQMIIVLGIFGVIRSFALCFILILMCDYGFRSKHSHQCISMHFDALARSCVQTNAMAYKHILFDHHILPFIYVIVCLFSSNIHSFVLFFLNSISPLNVWFFRKLMLCYGDVEWKPFQSPLSFAVIFKWSFFFLVIFVVGLKSYSFYFSPTKWTPHNGTWKLD